ncbi:GGDEF domain-containing protein [Ponticoccus sp. SC2-23]|uniref:GGDEF domain-containing protein n=1 Tax=Alexandriicola marinus TaxID=2081710 RepID=UPI0013E0B38C|nr:GGDEF domain-containing protein [Alexandriicola marinus]MBM1221094.1 GGDEF domain-containing protein [Ponticoccus sp. SC6-9]MBM1225664.1 GGDEF domain-containing protein [Ponticoccus sp. SC6-15]MBM1227816.1 GGDEF domain-containing protein [Ponticoccus sp. SC6-38]MBM1234546.1 GGDEF domain-containing protein [Ponticoccus sp. SC6-45]MBM1238318.1 GGDEF domain-containing protein [Ponticoccus sp. SC6-49]MBM1243587.1 GGDEF domain-containing protein [Ponticoccus sp. SC2-64]MBM1248070.1 GGDEF domai
MQEFQTSILSERLRSDGIVRFMLLATLLGLGFSGLFLLVGAMNSLYGALAFSASVLVGWAFIARSKFTCAAVFVNLSMLLAVFWMIIFSSGFHSPFLIWLACPPLIIGLLVSWKWSILCGILIFLFSIGLKIADHTLVEMTEFQATHTDGMPHTVALLSVITAVITVIFFSYQNYRELVAIILDAQEKERTDGLTGILNRAGFNQVVSKLSEHGSEDTGALILFDVDKFKTINDTYGHIFGDYVLETIALKISGIVREIDALARIGGDEFALILPGVPHKFAVLVGQRVKDQIDATPFHAPCGSVVSVAVSVGVATCEDGDLCKTEPMMHLADTALYEAKTISHGVVVKRLEEFEQTAPFAETQRAATDDLQRRA